MDEAGHRVELKTDRLVLRPFHVEDVDNVFEYARDEEWGRFLPVPQPYTRNDAEEFVARAVLMDWEREALFALVIDGKVRGGVSLRSKTKPPRAAELGYSLSRSHWGRGLVREGAYAVVDWGFKEWDLAKVWATADVRNPRSQRVLEKLGMKREGVLRSHVEIRGERADHVYYGILQDEWVG